MDMRLLSMVAVAALFGMSAVAAILYLVLTEQERDKRPEHDAK
jgi:hypothetical protein